jgi:hypothetical protein
VDGEGGGKAKPGREYCAGDQARGEEAGRLAARGIARWAHRICLVKRIPSTGVSPGFPGVGNNASTFHHGETPAFSLLPISCKDSIFADVAVHLMCMKHF